MNEGTDFWGTLPSFLHWTPELATGKSKFLQRIGRESLCSHVTGFSRSVWRFAGAPHYAMAAILSTIQLQFSLVSLDDIFMSLEGATEHIEPCSHVLVLLLDSSSVMKLGNGEFFSNTISSQVQVIRSGKFVISQHTMDEICLLKPFIIIMKLWSFLGLCNVFYPLVPTFAQTAVPLGRDSKLDQGTHFNTLVEEETVALQTLQQRLIIAPALSFPRSYFIYTLDMDTSDCQFCIVVLPQQPTVLENLILNLTHIQYYT